MMFCSQLLRDLYNQCYIMITTLSRILQVWHTFSLQLNLGIGLCSWWNRVINLSLDRMDLNISTQCCLCEYVKNSLPPSE